MRKHGVFVFEALCHLLFISLVALLNLFYWTTFSTHTSFNCSCHGLFFSTCPYYIATKHHILIHWLLDNLGTVHIFLLLIIFHTFYSHAGRHCQLHLFLFLAHGHRISFIATWHWLWLIHLHILLWLLATAEHWIEATHHSTACWSKSSSYTIVNSLINLLLLVILLSSLVFQ